MEARGQVFCQSQTEVNQQQTARFCRKCRGGFQHWPLGWELVIPCPCPSPIRGCVFLNSKYIYLAITGTNLSVAAASCDFTFHCQTASVSWRNFFPPSCLSGFLQASLSGFNWKFVVWLLALTEVQNAMTSLSEMCCFCFCLKKKMIWICHGLWFYCLQVWQKQEAARENSSRQKTLDTWFQSRAYPIMLLIWLFGSKHSLLASPS